MIKSWFMAGSTRDQRMKQILHLDEEVKFSPPADLNLYGYFDNCALFITDERIISFDPHHTNGMYELAIEDVEEAQIEIMYGNSILKVSSKGEVIELNRYTHTVSDLFKDACEYINRNNKENSDIGYDTKEGTHRKHRCPKCGRNTGPGLMYVHIVLIRRRY